MNSLKINVGGIKCDNKACDFNDMAVPFEDYGKWLNKPCPKCGSNLLTQQDFDILKVLMDVTGIINEVMPEAKEGEELYKMSADFDGTGKVVFSEIEPMDQGRLRRRGDEGMNKSISIDCSQCGFKDKGFTLSCVQCMEELGIYKDMPSKLLELRENYLKKYGRNR